VVRGGIGKLKCCKDFLVMSDLMGKVGVWGIEQNKMVKEWDSGDKEIGDIQLYGSG
jgi:hypothetical protein